MKQTLMLMDKSGLRRKNASSEATVRKKSSFSSHETEHMTESQEHENAVRMALETGIGYNQYKKEVDAIRAQKIRERLENDNKED